MLTTCSARPSRRECGSDSNARPLLESQREALARCEYLVESHQPLGIVLGPTGTGKSDLLRRLAAGVAATGKVVLIDATGLCGGDLIADLAVELDVPGAAADRAAQLRGIRDRLQGGSDCGATHLLLLDHLDAARPDALDVVAHLLRVASANGGLTVIATARGLSLPGLIELQRDFGWVRIEIDSLSVADGIAAAQTIIDPANATVRPISTRAAREAHELSQGVPRELRRVVQLTALAADAEHAEVITDLLVRNAARESVGQLGR